MRYARELAHPLEPPQEGAEVAQVEVAALWPEAAIGEPETPVLERSEADLVNLDAIEEREVPARRSEALEDRLRSIDRAVFFRR